MNTIKTNESGRSMIEMLGVLAIIGVLSVGGIAGYSKAMNKFKTNQVADNVSMLVANIKTLYAQQKTYGTLTNADAVSLGVVPDELIKDRVAGTLKNSFNGTVDIHSAESTSDGDNKAFVIYYGGLSKEACITLSTNDWGSGYSSGLIAIRAAGDSTDADDNKSLDTVHIGTAGAKQTTDIASNAKGGAAIATPGGSTLKVPMPVSEAAKACACNLGNTCSITWKYY